MKTVISQQDFAALLRARGGAFPVSVLTRTEPKLKKTGNPYADRGVVRITKRNGFVGGDYESIANNKREKDGGERDFEAGSLPWGTHLDRYFIGHKDALYLKFFPIRAAVEGIDEWQTSDGQPVPFDAIAPFLPERKEADSGVPWRVITLRNIIEATLNGEEYVIR
jgi:hypothetical protein